MKRQRSRVILALLATLLLISPLMGACGGTQEKNREIVIGFLGDQTGPSAEAFASIMKSINDYIYVMEKENPIPGVTVKLVTYDTRYEYGRVPAGYEFLLDRGMVLLLQYMGDQQPITLGSQKEDGIPSFAFAEKKGLEDESQVFVFTPEYYWEGRGVMDYILGTWTAGLGRPLKVGHLAMAGYSTDDSQHAGLAAVAAENPGKLELVTEQGQPTSTAWASEFQGLKDCDVIVTGSVGPATPTFLNEVRQRGYKGKIIALSQSALGYWSGIKTAVPSEYLDGLLCIHWYPHWTDDSGFIREVEEDIAAYFPDRSEELHQGTAWLTQQITARILTEAVRNAAAEVGPDKIDGSAMRDALEATSIELDGMGESITCHDGHHVMYRMYRMIEYSSAADEWSAITNWALPSGLAG